MNKKMVFLLSTLATLSVPALADTAPKATQLSSCELSGSFSTITDDCKALQMAFQAEVGDCMAGLRADAAARTGRASPNNSHSSRAQFLTCTDTVRTRMGVVSD